MARSDRHKSQEAEKAKTEGNGARFDARLD
jgi:hypothetical protein